MMWQPDRPSFDDVMSPFMAAQAPTNANTVGIITAWNDVTYRADVFLPEHNVTLPGVRLSTNLVAGDQAGEFIRPKMGTECVVEFDKGRGAGIGQASIRNFVYSGTHRPPAHPSITDTPGPLAARQMPSDSGDDATTPGSVEVHDARGGRHVLQMGKTTQMGQGPVDQRDKGLNVTQPQEHCARAQNGMFEAKKLLASLPGAVSSPEQVVGSLAKLGQARKLISGSSRATNNAAGTMAQQAARLGQAWDIGQGAADLAQGLTNG